MDHKSTINFLTLNVNGLVMADRRRLIFNSIVTLQKDIVFLQETHLVNDQHVKEVSDLWKGPSVWAVGTSHSKGVGILFSPRVHVKIISQTIDPQGRFILVHCNLLGHPFAS
jgi:exonuclease III